MTRETSKLLRKRAELLLKLAAGSASWAAEERHRVLAEVAQHERDEWTTTSGGGGA